MLITVPCAFTFSAAVSEFTAIAELFSCIEASASTFELCSKGSFTLSKWSAALASTLFSATSERSSITGVKGSTVVSALTWLWGSSASVSWVTCFTWWFSWLTAISSSTDKSLVKEFSITLWGSVSKLSATACTFSESSISSVLWSFWFCSWTWAFNSSSWAWFWAICFRAASWASLNCLSISDSAVWTWRENSELSLIAAFSVAVPWGSINSWGAVVVWALSSVILTILPCSSKLGSFEIAFTKLLWACSFCNFERLDMSLISDDIPSRWRLTSLVELGSTL